MPTCSSSKSPRRWNSKNLLFCSKMRQLWLCSLHTQLRQSVKRKMTKLQISILTTIKIWLSNLLSITIFNWTSLNCLCPTIWTTWWNFLSNLSYHSVFIAQDTTSGQPRSNRWQPWLRTHIIVVLRKVISDKLCQLFQVSSCTNGRCVKAD